LNQYPKFSSQPNHFLKNIENWLNQNFKSLHQRPEFFNLQLWLRPRISVQGVKSLCGHFACLCRGFEFYEEKKKKKIKKKMEILLHFLSFL
jgi:hypothetical protein